MSPINNLIKKFWSMEKPSFFRFYFGVLFSGLFLVFDLQIFSFFFIINHGFLLSFLTDINFPFFCFILFFLSSKLDLNRLFFKRSLFEKFFV